MGPLYRTTLPMTPREVADRPERAVHRLGRAGTLHSKRVLLSAKLYLLWSRSRVSLAFAIPGVGQGPASRTSQRVTDTKCQPGAPLTFSVERIMGVEGHPPPGGGGRGIVPHPFTGERSSGRSFLDHFSPFLLPALLSGREEEAPASPHAGPHAPRARIVLDLIGVLPFVARSPLVEGSPPW